MSYTLIFLAFLLGAVVWWLVKQTINLEPWIANAATDSVRDEGVRSPLTTLPLASVKLGLGVFLAVATSLFALFISAYTIRMEYFDWRPLSEPALLWANSGILVMSSIFLQWGWTAADRGDMSTVKTAVSLGGLCAIGFIAGQLIAWKQLTGAGYLITDNPANAFFYLLTGVHGLHLFGGLIALTRSLNRIWRGDDIVAIRVGVELCAIYWHYLLAIWLILFGLLLTT